MNIEIKLNMKIFEKSIKTIKLWIKTKPLLEGMCEETKIDN